MKEYILTNIANHLPANRKTDVFIQEVKIYQDFLFNENDISEFIEFLDAKCSRLNSAYNRTKKFTLVYHNGVDGSFWISVRTDVYDECSFMFTMIAGKWHLPKKEDA